MDGQTEEAILYITAGLCTFLAIICSYRWLVGPSKKTKEEEKKADTKIEKEEIKKDEDSVEDKEEEDNKVPPVVCPFSLLMSKAENMAEVEAIPSKEELGDILIDSSEIQPVDKDALTEEGDMVNHWKVKELEDEVIQSMTDEQLDEERTARQSQLEAIFKLMQNNKDTFGMASVDDVQNQYKLYV